MEVWKQEESGTGIGEDYPTSTRSCYFRWSSPWLPHIPPRIFASAVCWYQLRGSGHGWVRCCHRPPCKFWGFTLVCRRFCPQDGRKEFNLRSAATANKISKEGMEAWCLAWRVCSSRPRNGEIKLEPSGVPVVFEICETLVVKLSESESLRGDGNKMKVGRGRVFWHLKKLKTKS